MNRVAQRVEPVMNSRELSAVLDDHYTAEAQTLGAGAEANLLKLRELRGTLTGEQAVRWGELKTAYARERGAAEDEPLRRAVAALGVLAERIGAVESAITRASGPG